MARRRGLQIFLVLLALVLIGTVLVLSSISFYLAIKPADYITEDEVGPMEANGTRWNASEHGMVERIPRILHQTWKTDTLPDKWKDISADCRAMMPDYEYMLWTDDGSRDFIAEHYPWFLDTFTSYTYPIQRADAIRYFILYHYGGIYLDLDVGCRRPLDRLLTYQIILPKTIPVGVSNDLMFAARKHPFMEQTIHSLVAFDHSWVLNYPTVMFSTGPMFLSAQYGMWASSKAPAGQVRILPKALYGKNAKPGEAPHAFFSHYYGSSWHADDAAFIGFLGKWGKGLMWVGLVVLVVGVGRLGWQRRLANKRGGDGSRRVGGYEVLLPRSHGRWVVPGLFAFILPGSRSNSASTTPIHSPTLHDDEDNENMPMLPFTIDMRHTNTDTDADMDVDIEEGNAGNTDTRRQPPVHLHPGLGSPTLHAIYKAGNRILTSLTGARSPDRDRGRDVERRRVRSRGGGRHGANNRGILFFLPAILTSASASSPVDVEGQRERSSSRRDSRQHQGQRQERGSSTPTATTPSPLSRAGSRRASPLPFSLPVPLPLQRSFSHQRTASSSSMNVPGYPVGGGGYPVDKPVQIQRRYTDEGQGQGDVSLHGQGHGQANGQGNGQDADLLGVGTPGLGGGLTGGFGMWMGSGTSSGSAKRASSSVSPSPRSTSPGISVRPSRVGSGIGMDGGGAPPPYQASVGVSPTAGAVAINGGQGLANNGQANNAGGGGVGGAPAPGSPWTGAGAWEEWEARMEGR